MYRVFEAGGNNLFATTLLRYPFNDGVVLLLRIFTNAVFPLLLAPLLFMYVASNLPLDRFVELCHLYLG